MTSEIYMSMNEYLPLRDVVFNTLREAILHGELQPGERLMEISLANRLGVSRTPVREAIRKLELEGLVIMVPRKGAQVAKITEKDLNDVLEVRMGLEELAMRFACERIDEEQLKKIADAANVFEKLMESNDITALAQADVRFHELIYDATQNKRLVQIISNLREQMYRYRIEYLKDSTARATLVKEHRGIYQALKNKDCVQAHQWMRSHIENQQKAIIKSLHSGE